MNVYRIAISLIFFNIFIQSYSQTENKPKIIVGIVVDQMRFDFLTRYEHNYSDGGFKRLMKGGFNAENMMYNYVPTYTGPGHTSIYTGSVPAIHGIAANNWIHNSEKDMYCSQDDDVKSIGGDEKNGKMSPKNNKASTVTDQLRLFTNKQSKVYGLSIKDRGAIFPAGSLANGAFWYDSKTGNWITSSWYMDTLPKWLQHFNSKKVYEKYLSQNWNLLYDKSKYSGQDDVPWEEQHGDEKKSTLPYTFDPSKYAAEIRYTPFGNSITTDMAIETISNENMGKGKFTDFLAISYSSPDYIGHAYGPYSTESEDNYYRLDLEIKKLLEFLDLRYGKDNYWVFLSADHGVQDVPGFSLANKMRAGNITDKELSKKIVSYLDLKTGKKGLVKKVMNEQIYIHKDSLELAGLDVKKLAEILQNMPPMEMEGIHGFYAFSELSNYPLPSALREKMINGYAPNRSGDIAILMDPNWISHGKRGTTHGTPYNHDSHVPFIFYGKGVKAKSSATSYSITDIAPTLSYLLGILQPNGCIGKPIIELEYLRK